MGEAIKAVADIFTGKGGTIRLAIFGSLFSAVIFEILDSKYDLTAKTSSGASISLTPGYERTMSTSLDSDNVPNEGDLFNAEEKTDVTKTSGQSPTEENNK